MAFENALPLAELPRGAKKTVKLGNAEILLVHTEDGKLHAVEAKCPHAGAPLEKGAVCDGKLICPWHAGTFALTDGVLLEPPPLRSLKSYAVQQKDGQIVVDTEARNRPSLANYDDQAPAAPQGDHLHFVTIGAGAAAAAAVCTLRQGGFAGRITMIDPRDTEPVDRTALSKMALSGDKPPEELALWTPAEQDALKVDRLSARVDTLEGKQGTLRLNDGVAFGFDAALLAPGGTPQWLGIAGEDLRHVHTLRHLRDLEGIDGLLQGSSSGRKVVLIGDSFIAFECASALIKRGLDVTVVCRSAQPFRDRFGEAPAAALVGLHRANGVTLKLGAEAREITPDAVILHSGESLPADLVLEAIGVRPATDFEHDVSISKDGTVGVDATLKAAAKLWVGGDAATVDGVHIEHWRVAQQHGRAAALGMLREMNEEPALPFGGVPFFWTYHFGKRFGYAGHAEKWDDLQVDGSLEDAKFVAYYVQGGRVKAVLGCGMDAAIAMLAERLHQSLNLAAAREAATNV